MLGELTPTEIDQVLVNQAVGRIGCHVAGRTYVVPVAYVYDGNRVICHSAEGRKIRMMRVNPDVCFEVEQIEGLATWKSVIAWGRFEELHGNEAAAGMGLLVDRLQPLMGKRTGESAHRVTPHGKAFGESTVVYAIRFSEKTGRSEGG